MAAWAGAAKCGDGGEPLDAAVAFVTVSGCVGGGVGEEAGCGAADDACVGARGCCVSTSDADCDEFTVYAAVPAVSRGTAAGCESTGLGERGAPLCTAMARSKRSDAEASRVGVRDGGTVVAVGRGVELPEGVAVTVADLANDASCTEGPWVEVEGVGLAVPGLPYRSSCDSSVGMTMPGSSLSAEGLTALPSATDDLSSALPLLRSASRAASALCCS